MDTALLAFDGADLKTLILGSLNNFMSMQSIESFRSIFPRYFDMSNDLQEINRSLRTDISVNQDRGASRMQVFEFADIKYFGVDDNPLQEGSTLNSGSWPGDLQGHHEYYATPPMSAQ